MLDRPGKKWRHEDASEMMFDSLIKLDHVQVSEREAVIVKALIAGEVSRCRSVWESIPIARRATHE